VQRDPAKGVDDLAEAVEVDQQVVVDGDLQALLVGLDEAAGAVVEGRVDLGRPAGAGHRDVQVAGDRQHGRVAGRGRPGGGGEWHAAPARGRPRPTPPAPPGPPPPPTPPPRKPWRVSEPTTSRLTDPSAGALPRPGTCTEPP